MSGEPASDSDVDSIPRAPPAAPPPPPPPPGLPLAPPPGRAALLVEEADEEVDGVEATASTASSTAERAASNVASLQRSTQEAFTAVAGEIGKVNGELAKLQEAATKASAPKAAGAKSTGPVVAGPDEYVIVGGDTGAKIARAKGVTLGDLVAVNPGVNWTGLKVGQKIKLPAKK